MPGAGSDGNASFRIVGDQLQSVAVFDYATKSSYSVRIRTTDTLGFFLEKVLTINVVDAAHTVSIGNRVWNDLNGNGLQNTGEAGLAGVVVELYVSPNGTVGSATDVSCGQIVTDANGNYSFDRLLSGFNYYLTFRAPTGYAFTSANVGSDDTIDSDANATGTTGIFTLTSGVNDATRDAGVKYVGPSFPVAGYALQAGASGDDSGQSVALDAAGNVYVTGLFQGTVDFDPGPGVYSLTSAGGNDIFVAKYSSTGTLVFARGMGGSGDDSGTGITLGPDGNVHLTGTFSETADFDPTAGKLILTSAGAKDAFVAKMDTNGNVLWARNFGGIGEDLSNAVAVASDGSVYTTGSFQNTGDFDPSSGVYNLTSIGPRDIFVSKLDSAGNFVWARRMGGIGWSQGLSAGKAVAIGPDGGVYTTGGFQGIADFDPGPAAFTVTSAGQKDAFVLKLDSTGKFVWAGSMGGTLDDSANSIAVAFNGAIYTTGYFQGTVPFDTTPNGFRLNSAGGQDLFVSKVFAASALTVAVNQAPTQIDPTSDSTIHFRVVFSSPVTDFVSGDVTLGGTAPGTLVALVSPVGTDGTVYDVAVTGMAGNGTVTASLAAGVTHDADSNANLAYASSDNSVAYVTTPAGPPTFSLSGPASGTFTPGAAVPIQWTAGNVGTGSKISLCYDTDTVWNGNEKWIEIDQVAAVNGNDSFNWNTAGVSAGTYYVAGYLWSGGTATRSHLTQTITIQGGSGVPTFSVVGPTSGTFASGQVVPIQLSGNNGGGGGKVSLCYDTDTVWNGNEHWIEVDQVTAPVGNGGVYNWDTTGVKAGTYYLGGYLWSNGTAMYSHLTQSINIAAPMTLAASPVVQVAQGTVLDNREELATIVAEARRRLAEQLGSAATAALADVSVEIANLPGMLLGESVGKKVLIDRAAAGYGWFVDSTPQDDMEFADIVGPHTLAARKSTVASQRVDLLTTVMHEMGHVLGYDDRAATNDLMSATLAPGVRRTLVVDHALTALYDER